MLIHLWPRAINPRAWRAAYGADDLASAAVLGAVLRAGFPRDEAPVAATCLVGRATIGSASTATYAFPLTLLFRAPTKRRARARRGQHPIQGSRNGSFYLGHKPCMVLGLGVHYLRFGSGGVVLMPTPKTSVFRHRASGPRSAESGPARPPRREIVTLLSDSISLPVNVLPCHSAILGRKRAYRPRHPIIRARRSQADRMGVINCGVFSASSSQATFGRPARAFTGAMEARKAPSRAPTAVRSSRRNR
jgi:hypothetical protein